MSNQAAEIEEATAKAISKYEERHRVKKQSSKKRMEPEWREVVCHPC